MTALWEGRRVLVCVGQGGVGKTSVAGAVALAAAAAGRRTLVMTIDPARRLGHALGLADAGNVEHVLEPAVLLAAGLTTTVPVTVMMPDVKRTFDGMVERFASPEQAQQLFANRVYQRFSTVLSGTVEYAAVEKLYEVYDAQRFDLIVLDTPPAQNAADFLAAPGKVLDFLEQESPEWLLKPYRVASQVSQRLFDFGGSLVLRTLDRFAGAETLRELAEFVMAFQGMYEGFRTRYRQVRTLLASEHVAFVLVTSARQEQRAAALRFRVELEAAGLDVAAVLVNRLRPPLGDADEALALLSRAEQRLAEQATALSPAVRQGVIAAAADELALAQEDTTALRQLRAALGNLPVVGLPELEIDVHDLAALATLAKQLPASI